MLLVVEDNGEGVNIPTPDKLTWGVYENSANTWIPRDAERDDDEGALLAWIAKDAERPDDAGVSFADIKHGGGNVQVQP